MDRCRISLIDHTETLSESANPEVSSTRTESLVEEQVKWVSLIGGTSQTIVIKPMIPPNLTTITSGPVAGKDDDQQPGMTQKLQLRVKVSASCPKATIDGKFEISGVKPVAVAPRSLDESNQLQPIATFTVSRDKNGTYSISTD